LSGDGLTAIWQSICDYRQSSEASGALTRKRRDQQVTWMWSLLEERLFAKLRADPELKARLPQLEKAVAAGTLSPMLAVEEIAGAMKL
jgi:LAO/AO transport system kinase